MGSLSQSLCLLLIIILATPTLLIIQPANAQSIPKPSTPEFTLTLVSQPYNVSTTYATSTPNPYTGKTETIITQPGYFVENKSVEVTIKNQPYTSTLDANGNYTSLYYNFMFKGHNATEWNYWPPIGSGMAHTEASKSNYTVIAFTLGKNGILWDAPVGGEVDFQVQAMIGHDNQFADNTKYSLPKKAPYTYVYTGETSNWSETQTVTILDSSSLSLPAPTPTVPEFPWLIFPFFVSVLSATALLVLKKRHVIHE